MGSTRAATAGSSVSASRSRVAEPGRVPQSLRMSRAAEWEVRVAEWRASGLTAKEFCMDREYSAQNLLYWSSTLQRRGREQPRAARDVTLARVVRREHHERARKTPAAIVVRTRMARVEVRPGVDAATLALVLAALGAVGSAS